VSDGQRRTGTIPVPLTLEKEIPWKKVALGGICSLGFLLVLSLASRPSIPPDPQEVVNQLERTDPDAAIKLAKAELQESIDAARHWHVYLAQKLEKAGNKEEAFSHYQWLVRNYPQDAGYKRGLNSTMPKKPPQKKKPKR